MIELRLTYQRRPVKTVQFDQEEMVIGRDADCAIPIDNIGISRRHASIERFGEFYLLKDLGSENGTYIRGRRVKFYCLNDEDEICISNYSLFFRRVGGESTFDSETAGAAGAREKNLEVTMPLDVREMDRMQMERSSAVTGYLKFLNPSGREDTFTLLKSTVFFGSHRKSDFVCPGWFLLGKHAVVVRDEFGFRVISLNPKKLIRVNGKEVDEYRLKDTDKFVVGTRVFEFHFGVPTK